nr:restriction endonuclease [Lysinibacillus timonensis]
MRNETTKEKEAKMTQLIILGIFGFGIVISLLNSLSIEPSLSNIQFYLFLLVVLGLLYKPFGGFILKNIRQFFRFVKLALNTLFFKRVPKISIQQIDEFSGKEFELFLKPLFEKEGYTTEIMKCNGNKDANIVLSKDNIKYVVLAKRKNSKVGVKAIQEVMRAIKHYKATGAIIVTNQYFTTNAKKLALSNKITLIDRDELVNMIKTTNKKYRFATTIS